MATFTFANITGVTYGQIETEGFGRMNFPILLLDQPLTTNDGWFGNTGQSPNTVIAEFSICRDRVPRGTPNYMSNDGQIINIKGGATLKRDGDSYVFSLPENSVVVRSGFSSVLVYEVTAPFTALMGTNGNYAIGSGTWTSWVQNQIIYQSCSIGSSGYATCSGIIKSGDFGPLAFGFNANTIPIVTEWIKGHTKKPSTDPYDPGETSEPEGGEGDFDDTTDPVDFPDLPTISSVDTGFITLFNPSMAELKNLANYMWSQAFDLATLKKLFADPMDCILGLSIVPVAVPNAGQKAVTVGNISTGVTMNAAAAQYVELDCGTLNVNEYWGAYLDYDPFTKCEIYLPYIGTHALAVDDVMKKAVHVKYHIDLLSGAMAAYVKCGDSVLYEFIGQCASSIPITGNDWTNVINGVLGIAGSIGSMVATGGASAPLAVPGIASTAVNALKPNVEKSGSLSGTGGMLGIQTPYLILTRPRQSLPSNQNEFIGYPSNITMSLGDCDGFTEVESVHLNNIPCTENELLEIETLLKSGVIF